MPPAKVTRLPPVNAEPIAVVSPTAGARLERHAPASATIIAIEARAADVGVALGDRDGAVLVTWQAALGRRRHCANSRGVRAGWVEPGLQMLARLGRFQRLLIAVLTR